MAGLFGLQKFGDAVRSAAVAGSFYPGDPRELRAQLDVFFQEYAPVAAGRPVRAVIVPHAGYVFSGAVAASAYSHIPAGTRYDRIFLIGPAHRACVEGASVDTAFGRWETPLGSVPIDREICRKLGGSSGFTYLPATPVATLRRARNIARAAGIRHIHPGNVPGEV